MGDPVCETAGISWHLRGARRRPGSCTLLGDGVGIRTLLWKPIQAALARASSALERQQCPDARSQGRLELACQVDRFIDRESLWWEARALAAQ
jgi:hypothetical protein